LRKLNEIFCTISTQNNLDKTDNPFVPVLLDLICPIKKRNKKYNSGVNTNN